MISVITVCLNAASRIETAIQSLLAQTYQNFEYIVIDGGSSDGTVSIVEKYRDRIATLISEPDGGIYHAMNKGLTVARGELVYFLNADDALHDEHVFAHAVSAFKRFPLADVIYGDALLCYPDGTEKLSRYPNLLFWEHFRDRSLCHQSMFTKRTAFQRVGMFETSYRLAADYAWILKSIWDKDLNYQYIPLTICTFSMAGRHRSDANKGLLHHERTRAISEYVGECFDFIGSYQRSRLTPLALFAGDPDYPITVVKLFRGNYREFFAELGQNLRQTNRLRWYLFRLYVHRLIRRLSAARKNV